MVPREEEKGRIEQCIFSCLFFLFYFPAVWNTPAIQLSKLIDCFFTYLLPLKFRIDECVRSWLCQKANQENYSLPFIQLIIKLRILILKLIFVRHPNVRPVCRFLSETCRTTWLYMFSCCLMDQVILKKN